MKVNVYISELDGEIYTVDPDGAADREYAGDRNYTFLGTEERNIQMPKKTVTKTVSAMLSTYEPGVNEAKTLVPASAKNVTISYDIEE